AGQHDQEPLDVTGRDGDQLGIHASSSDGRATRVPLRGALVGVAHAQHGGPGICSDRGNPLFENPLGTATAGSPVMLKGGMLLRGNPKSGSKAFTNGVAGP